jgi:hypothetical protein
MTLKVNLTSSGHAHLVPKKVDWDSTNMEEAAASSRWAGESARLQEIYWSFFKRVSENMRNRKMQTGVWGYDRGKPVVSYRWTGWVNWEITGWSSRLQGKLPVILEEFIEYTPI